ncbi:MAG: VOC family protein [Candidatus Bathyarchaeota archaeon]|nr:MAG: VOC family protein [Candidatus Bathyarchaeota archaeon]
MFKSIRALAVYVTDLERAKRFYTEVLSFKLSVDLEPNLCFLKSKSGDINIYMEGGKSQTSIDDQTSRLSFFLQAERSASETYAVLKAAGVKLLQEAPELVGGETACFQFEDPDGNIIEVCGKP